MLAWSSSAGSGSWSWWPRSRACAGEAIALRRSDLDLDTGSVIISRQYVELSGQLVIGPPKSRAGTRTVGIPAAVAAELRQHLDLYVAEEATALVFAGASGGVLRRGNFRRASGWAAAVGQLGVQGLHFHDLRHTALDRQIRAARKG